MDWQIGLADWHLIVVGLVLDRRWVGDGLALDCRWIDIGLGWIRYGLALD